MEKIEQIHERLVNAQKALEVSMDRYTNPPEHADAIDITLYMTAVIKSFEFTHGCLWVFLKAYLKKEGIDTLGSKDVFRKCYEYKLTNAQESQILVNAVEDRNVTAHQYEDETTIQTMSNKIIKEYYPVLKSVIERTESLIPR